MIPYSNALNSAAEISSAIAHLHRAKYARGASEARLQEAIDALVRLKMDTEYIGKLDQEDVVNQSVANEFAKLQESFRRPIGEIPLEDIKKLDVTGSVR